MPDFDWADVVKATTDCQKQHGGEIPEGWVLVLPPVNVEIVEMAEDIYDCEVVSRIVTMPEWRAVAPPKPEPVPLSTTTAVLSRLIIAFQDILGRPIREGDLRDAARWFAETNIDDINNGTFAYDPHVPISKQRPSTHVFIATRHDQATHTHHMVGTVPYERPLVATDPHHLRGYRWQDGDRLTIVKPWEWKNHEPDFTEVLQYSNVPLDVIQIAVNAYRVREQQNPNRPRSGLDPNRYYQESRGVMEMRFRPSDDDLKALQGAWKVSELRRNKVTMLPESKINTEEIMKIYREGGGNE